MAETRETTLALRRWAVPLVLVGGAVLGLLTAMVLQLQGFEDGPVNFGTFVIAGIVAAVIGAWIASLVHRRGFVALAFCFAIGSGFTPWIVVGFATLFQNVHESKIGGYMTLGFVRWLQCGGPVIAFILGGSAGFLLTKLVPLPKSNANPTLAQRYPGRR